jgi:hypothetical protein
MLTLTLSGVRIFYKYVSGASLSGACVEHISPEISPWDPDWMHVKTVPLKRISKLHISNYGHTYLENVYSSGGSSEEEVKYRKIMKH